MRPYRILLTAVPYVVILIALAVGRLWWWFGVAAVATALIWTSTLILAVHAHRRRRSGRPLTGREVPAFLERNWWQLAAVMTVLGGGAFFPVIRREAWWVLPLYALALFVTFSVVFRLVGRSIGKYEKEFQRFTSRGRDTPERF